MESSVMLGSIPFFIQPHFGGFLRWRCTAPLAHADVGRFFAMGMAIRRRWQPPKGGCIIIAPGWLAYLGSVEK